MPSKVILQHTEVISDTHFRFEKLRVQNETFAGGMSKPATREMLRSGRSVAVLLYDPATDCVVLTQQFRLGAYLNKMDDPWLIEAVAGMVDGGEDTETAAPREVKEETGCDLSQLERIGEYMTSPGITDELITIYLGQVQAGDFGGVHGKASEAADIRTVVLPRNEAMLKEVLNIATQVALLWLNLHLEDLRERWS